MTLTREDLQAISELLDEKFEEKFDSKFDARRDAKFDEKLEPIENHLHMSILASGFRLHCEKIERM